MLQSYYGIIFYTALTSLVVLSGIWLTKRAWQHHLSLVNVLQNTGFWCVLVQTRTEHIRYVTPSLRKKISFNTVAQLESYFTSEPAISTPLRSIMIDAIHHGHSHNIKLINNDYCLEVSAIYLPNRSSVMFLVRDLTEARRTEEALRRALEIAEQANHAKGNFLANMSHELKTPLNIIIGFSDMIRNQMWGALNNDKYMDYVEAIHRSGSHLLDLISDILDMSRIETGAYLLNCNTYHPYDVAQDAVKLLNPLAEHRETTLFLNNMLPSADFEAYGDARAIKQVLINLMNNAVRYCPRASCVELRVSVDDQQRLNFEVADDGPGIPSDVLQAIGTPFISSKRLADITDSMREGSTGLGLSIVTSLIKLHHGTFSVTSSDKGSCIHVSVPLYVANGQNA